MKKLTFNSTPPTPPAPIWNHLLLDIAASVFQVGEEGERGAHLVLSADCKAQVHRRRLR